MAQNKQEMICELTDNCYSAEELANEIIKMRDAMVRYFLSAQDNEFDHETCHHAYEFATTFAEMLR